MLNISKVNDAVIVINFGNESQRRGADLPGRSTGGVSRPRLDDKVHHLLFRQIVPVITAV
ncbi:hypothetical protein [Zobellella sp. An-6]|uniref:hypothetical protein n=1 Tax=Zobellella sp. An-6 TaxID=3400218 RepID=UPI00404329F8